MVVDDPGQPSEEGELWLRLEPVREMMSGYYKDPAATEVAFTKGLDIRK